MSQEFTVGGLYSILTKERKIKVAKVLLLENEGVHIRVYKNIFNDRPTEIDENLLVVGKINDEEFSAGHLPITLEIFTKSQPIFIKQSPISEAELEGYKIWQDSGGGYFTTDL